MSSLCPPPSGFSASSAPEALMMSMKPGCRGDPRMNRAVAAKLDNPHISLYDALVAGGFNYPRNVDAATMDNDRVTLGQRKNQLNRRLRSARKSQQKKSETNKASSASSPSSNKSSTPGISSLAIANSYIRQRRNKTASKPAATKRASPVQDEQQGPEVKKQRLDDVSSVVASCNGNSQNQALSLTHAVTTSFMAGRAQANISPMVDDIRPFSGSQPSNNYNANSISLNTTTQQENSWWPASNALLNNTNEELNIRQAANLVSADFSPDCLPLDNNLDLDLAFPSNENKRTVSTASLVVPQQQQHRHQNVGSVASVEGFTDNGKKEELALLFFQAGLQELYQKSMMAAGYSRSEATETSPAFQKFAFQAWKNECERLQVLLQDHTVEPESSEDYF